MRIVTLLLVLGTALGCYDVDDTHVVANLPEDERFDALLRRDLSLHFEGASVQFELLRKEPTQSGIAYPKYYAWVRIEGGAGPIEGAVRVAAIEKERFEVTDFLSADEIRSHPDRVDLTFPSALSATIKQRARGAVV